MTEEIETYDQKMKRLWEKIYQRELSRDELREINARFEAWIDLALAFLPIGEKK